MALLGLAVQLYVEKEMREECDCVSKSLLLEAQSEALKLWRLTSYSRRMSFGLRDISDPRHRSSVEISPVMSKQKER